MKKVLLLGAQGQVGSVLEPLLIKNLYEVLAIKHSDINLCDENELNALFKAYSPDVIINCAAFTDVEKAEDCFKDALLVNAKLPLNLALYANQEDIPLIHLSSDYVLKDGIIGKKDENTPCEPLSNYAKSKYQGELVIINNCKKYLILRTAWLFSSHHKNFVKAIFSKLKTEEQIEVVKDQRGNPTSVEGLSQAIISLMPLIFEDNFTNWGLYHLAGDKCASWYEFALDIYKLSKVKGYLSHDVTIEPIKSSLYHSKAIRPMDSSLDCSKAKNNLKVIVPSYDNYLPQVLYELYKSNL